MRYVVATKCGPLWQWHVLDIRALARAVVLQTLCVLASVSKLMIALAIMQVVNAGVVDLDVPL